MISKLAMTLDSQSKGYIIEEIFLQMLDSYIS